MYFFIVFLIISIIFFTILFFQLFFNIIRSSLRSRFLFLNFSPKKWPSIDFEKRPSRYKNYLNLILSCRPNFFKSNNNNKILSYFFYNVYFKKNIFKLYINEIISMFHNALSPSYLRESKSPVYSVNDCDSEVEEEDLEEEMQESEEKEEIEIENEDEIITDDDEEEPDEENAYQCSKETMNDFEMIRIKNIFLFQIMFFFAFGFSIAYSYIFFTYADDYCSTFSINNCSRNLSSSLNSPYENNLVVYFFHDSILQYCDLKKENINGTLDYSCKFNFSYYFKYGENGIETLIFLFALSFLVIVSLIIVHYPLKICMIKFELFFQFYLYMIELPSTYLSSFLSYYQRYKHKAKKRDLISERNRENDGIKVDKLDEHSDERIYNSYKKSLESNFFINFFMNFFKFTSNLNKNNYSGDFNKIIDENGNELEVFFDDQSKSAYFVIKNLSYGTYLNYINESEEKKPSTKYEPSSSSFLTSFFFTRYMNQFSSTLNKKNHFLLMAKCYKLNLLADMNINEEFRSICNSFHSLSKQSLRFLISFHQIFSNFSNPFFIFIFKYYKLFQYYLTISSLSNPLLAYKMFYFYTRFFNNYEEFDKISIEKTSEKLVDEVSRLNETKFEEPSPFHINSKKNFLLNYLRDSKKKSKMYEKELNSYIKNNIDFEEIDKRNFSLFFINFFNGEKKNLMDFLINREVKESLISILITNSLKSKIKTKKKKRIFNPVGLFHKFKTFFKHYKKNIFCFFIFSLYFALNIAILAFFYLYENNSTFIVHSTSVNIHEYKNEVEFFFNFIFLLFLISFAFYLFIIPFFYLLTKDIFFFHVIRDTYENFFSVFLIKVKKLLKNTDQTKIKKKVHVNKRNKKKIITKKLSINFFSPYNFSHSFNYLIRELKKNFFYLYSSKIISSFNDSDFFMIDLKEKRDEKYYYNYFFYEEIFPKDDESFDSEFQNNNDEEAKKQMLVRKTISPWLDDEQDVRNTTDIYNEKSFEKLYLNSIQGRNGFIEKPLPRVKFSSSDINIEANESSKPVIDQDQLSPIEKLNLFDLNELVSFNKKNYIHVNKKSKTLAEIFSCSSPLILENIINFYNNFIRNFVKKIIYFILIVFLYNFLLKKICISLIFLLDIPLTKRIRSVYIKILFSFYLILISLSFFCMIIYTNSTNKYESDLAILSYFFLIISLLLLALFVTLTFFINIIKNFIIKNELFGLKLINKIKKKNILYKKKRKEEKSYAKFKVFPIDSKNISSTTTTASSQSSNEDTSPIPSKGNIKKKRKIPIDLDTKIKKKEKRKN